LAAANEQNKSPDGVVPLELDSPTSFPEQTTILCCELLAHLSNEDDFEAFGTQLDAPLVV